jgi:cysteine-rich repeat protein
MASRRAILVRFNERQILRVLKSHRTNMLPAVCLLLGAACGSKSGLSQRDGGDIGNLDSMLGVDIQIETLGFEAKIDASVDSVDSQWPDAAMLGDEPKDNGVYDTSGQDLSPNFDAGGLVGQECGTLGMLACAGPNQQLSLICSAGKWQVLSICGEGQRCDQSTGVCSDIIPVCAGREPGYLLCAGVDAVETCGPDLVTVTSTKCSGVCQAGVCQPPRCGDGKIEEAEACDDGNAIPGDGCEPDCELTKVIKLVAGRAHSCALLSEGNVRCWGANDKGQLGLGNVEDRGANKPYQNGLVALGGAAIAIAAGADHTCALMSDHTMQCWGANDHGQLGLGHTNPIGDDELPSADVDTVQLGLSVKTLATGGNVTCAILDDNTLRCWGQNNYGQLGLGNTQDVGDNELPSQKPVVSLGGSAKLVATGGNHTCAILLDGYTLRCWGRNGLGQLGLGITQDVGDDELPTDVNAVVFPADSSATTAMASLVVGASRACALRLDGVGRCWGDNSDGGLGVGYIGAKPNNTALDWGLWYWNSAMLEFGAGALHMCTAMANNQLRCWGQNGKAQLGLANTDTLGDWEDVLEVLPIDLGKGADGFASYAKTTATGSAHTCVVLGDGNVRCWGANESGQLGLGYKSIPPTDFIGGTIGSTPGKLDLVLVVHP